MTSLDVIDDANDALQPFAALIGRDFVDFIFEHAPRSVATRVSKALDTTQRRSD